MINKFDANRKKIQIKSSLHSIISLSECSKASGQTLSIDYYLVCKLNMTVEVLNWRL